MVLQCFSMCWTGSYRVVLPFHSSVMCILANGDLDLVNLRESWFSGQGDPPYADEPPPAAARVRVVHEKRVEAKARVGSVSV